jgi:hypothetical protein
VVQQQALVSGPASRALPYHQTAFQNHPARWRAPWQALRPSLVPAEERAAVLLVLAVLVLPAAL